MKLRAIKIESAVPSTITGQLLEHIKAHKMGAIAIICVGADGFVYTDFADDGTVKAQAHLSTLLKQWSVKYKNMILFKK